MIIQYLQWELIGQGHKLQVMGRDRADAILANHRPHIRATADQSFAVIGAFKDLVDQEEEGQRVRLLQLGEQGAQTPYFSVEVGIALSNRIADANTSEEAEELRLQMAGADRPPGIR